MAAVRRICFSGAGVCGLLEAFQAAKPIQPNQAMKTIVKTTGLAAFALAIAGSAWAQNNVVGTWKSQFDSQIGTQNYTFEFKMDGTNLVGRAIGVRQDATNNVAMTDIKIDADKVSFVEPLKIQDNDIRIEYSGTIAGDEMKLHRKVGDLAEYDITAKRAKAEAGTPTQPDAATATNSPPTKP